MARGARYLNEGTSFFCDVHTVPRLQCAPGLSLCSALCTTTQHTGSHRSIAKTDQKIALQVLLVPPRSPRSGEEGKQGACSTERAKRGRRYRSEARARKKTGASSFAEHGCVATDEMRLSAVFQIFGSSSSSGSSRREAVCCISLLPAYMYVRPRCFLERIFRTQQGKRQLRSCKVANPEFEKEGMRPASLCTACS